MPPDDDPDSGGIFPDPSTRTWRHPSELNQPTVDSSVGRSGGLPVWTAIGAIGALVLAGGALLFTETSRSSYDSDLWAIDGYEPGTDDASMPANPLPASPSTTAESVTTLALSTELQERPSQFTNTSVEEVDLSTLHPASPDQPGIFSGEYAEDRLASFMPHAGLLLTSASALGGRSSVMLWDSAEWQVATVVGVDPFSDLALLRPERMTEALNQIAPTMAQTDQGIGDPVVVRLADEVQIQGVTETNGWLQVSESITHAVDLEGKILQTGDHLPNKSGHVAYDLIVTSVASTAELVGGPLLDPQGRAMGVVVNSESPVVVAVPIETALETATNLSNRGVPSMAWVGIETALNADGTVGVSAVDPRGPCAKMLRVGDKLLTADGTTIEHPDQLVHIIRTLGPGAEIELVVVRDTEIFVVPLTVGERN